MLEWWFVCLWQWYIIHFFYMYVINIMYSKMKRIGFHLMCLYSFLYKWKKKIVYKLGKRYTYYIDKELQVPFNILFVISTELQLWILLFISCDFGVLLSLFKIYRWARTNLVILLSKTFRKTVRNIYIDRYLKIRVIYILRDRNCCISNW